MKNSIGSLAALAALATPALIEAAPLPPAQYSSFSNVALPTGGGSSVYFDIDGDSTEDFRVYANFGYIDLFSTGDTLFSANPVSAGTLFWTGDATTPNLNLFDFSNPNYASFYHGINFVTGGQNHSAWVQFDFTGPTPLLVAAAWQTHADYPVRIGEATAIPEPSTFGALAGAAVLAGAVYRRRRVNAS